MRRYLQPALESFSSMGELSLEEEQVVLAEAAQDESAIQADLNEAEHALEVSDALEDLAVVADGIEEATPAETQLVEIAGDMAAAGTDVAPEEIVPAMEGYIGRKISTEGIRETARQIWQSIMTFLKSVWERIEKFFYKIFGTIPGLRRRLEALEKRVDAASGLKVEDKKFKIGSGVAAFCIDYKPVKSESELAKAVDSIHTAAKFIYGRNTEAVAKLGESIADIIGDFEVEKATELANKMGAELKGDGTLLGKDLPGSSTAPSVPGFTTRAGEQLLGNVRLVGKTYAEKGEAGILGELDGFRRSGVELDKARDKVGTVPGDFEFATMSLSSATSMLKKAAEILDVLEDYKRGKGWKEVKKAQDKLKSASEKATKAFEKVKGSEEAADKAAVPYFKALLNFNQAYTRWVQSPAVPFFGHALTAVRASMIAVEKSLACYK